MKRYSVLILALVSVGVLGVAPMFDPASSVSASSLGQLDQTFGGTGEVIVPVAGEDWQILDVVVQPDGKILAAGIASDNTEPRMFAARFNSDGTPDTSWGINGRTEVSIQQVSTDSSGANAIALQSDGKVIIAGAMLDASNVSTMAMARLTASGQLDTTFGQAGIVLTNHMEASWIRDVLIEPDDSIVVVGASRETIQENGQPTQYFWSMVARYGRDGTLDTNGFYAAGPTPGLLSFNGSSSSSNGASSVTRRSDGYLIVGGKLNLAGTLAQVTPTGSLDSASFLNGGSTAFNMGGDTEVSTVALQSDGKIVIAGTSGTYPNTDLYVVRYDAGGAYDTAFVFFSIPVPDFAIAYDMAILRDDRIVVIGRTSQVGVKDDLTMWFANADGSRDTSVYPDARVIISRGGIAQGGDYRMRAIAIQADDKIVVAGELEQTDNQMALARFHSVIPAAPAPSSTTSSTSTSTSTSTTVAVSSASTTVASSTTETVVEGPDLLPATGASGMGGLVGLVMVLAGSLMIAVQRLRRQSEL